MKETKVTLEMLEMIKELFDELFAAQVRGTAIFGDQTEPLMPKGWTVFGTQERQDTAIAIGAWVRHEIAKAREQLTPPRHRLK